MINYQLTLKTLHLKDIMNWKKSDVNYIGIKDEKGKFYISPPDTTIISNGMKVWYSVPVIKLVK